MLNVLYKVEQELPNMLRIDGWNSLYIDYHTPFVERLWRQYGEYRISLHRIHACEEEAALFHPHPWPSAMRIVHGTYEMGVGHSTCDTVPSVVAKLVMPAGTAYEMVEPSGWHYVRPLADNTLSIMVTGRPWVRSVPQPGKCLRPLSSDVVSELLKIFSSHYS